MWVRAISGTVVSLLVVVVGIFAFRADGTPVHDVALTDGSIWASGGRSGYWGRVNTGSHSLDLVVRGAGAVKENAEVKPDILQDGRNVVGVTNEHELLAIDTRTGEPLGEPVEAPAPSFEHRSPIHEPDTVAMHGDTIAVVDHASGTVWAKRLDHDGGTALEGLMDSPLHNQLGRATSVTVSVDGDIMAVSAESGTVVEIPAEGDGFGEPETTDLPFSGSQVADITAVGDRWVVLDLEDGQVHAEGMNRPQAAPEGGEGERDQRLALATLQQPGPESDVVAVQTVSRAGYVQISEDTKSPGEVGIDSGLDPESSRARYIKLSRPVMNGDCLYGAWGNGNEVRWSSACGAVNEGVTTLQRVGSPTRQNGVAVRHNRGKVLLNDLDTGRIFDLSLPGDTRIDTWPGGARRERQEGYTPDWQKAQSASEPAKTSGAKPARSPKPTSTSSTSSPKKKPGTPSG